MVKKRKKEKKGLKVGVVSISVLVISVGKLSILLAVWDPPKWCVVLEARVEHLVHNLLCLFSTDVPHSQDGAQGAPSDASLCGRQRGQVLTEGSWA